MPTPPDHYWVPAAPRPSVPDPKPYPKQPIRDLKTEREIRNLWNERESAIADEDAGLVPPHQRGYRVERIYGGVHWRLELTGRYDQALRVIEEGRAVMDRLCGEARRWGEDEVRIREKAAGTWVLEGWDDPD